MSLKYEPASHYQPLIKSCNCGRCPLFFITLKFRGGLVFKAHRLCVSLNSRLDSNKEWWQVSLGLRREKEAARKHTEYKELSPESQDPNLFLTVVCPQPNALNQKQPNALNQF